MTQIASLALAMTAFPASCFLLDACAYDSDCSLALAMTLLPLPVP
jgi:hypothetical protein